MKPPVKKFFYFSDVDLSCHGPFADRQNLKLLPHFNFIAARNGMGKSTIFKTMRIDFSKYEDWFEGDLKILSSLIFLNYESLHSEGIPNGSIIFNKEKVDELEDHVSNYLKLIMYDKFIDKLNKFTSYTSIEKSLEVKIDIDGSWRIIYEKSVDITHNFQAQSEKIALFLSFNLAFRKILKINYPMVCDDLFISVERNLASGIIALLVRQGFQLIILESPFFWKDLSINPTLELVWDLEKKFSIIQSR